MRTFVIFMLPCMIGLLCIVAITLGYYAYVRDEFVVTVGCAAAYVLLIAISRKPFNALNETLDARAEEKDDAD
jgi:hypothetical protein